MMCLRFRQGRWGRMAIGFQVFPMTLDLIVMFGRSCMSQFWISRPVSCPMLDLCITEKAGKMSVDARKLRIVR